MELGASAFHITMNPNNRPVKAMQLESNLVERRHDKRQEIFLRNDHRPKVLCAIADFVASRCVFDLRPVSAYLPVNVYRFNVFLPFSWIDNGLCLATHAYIVRNGGRACTRCQGKGRAIHITNVGNRDKHGYGGAIGAVFRIAFSYQGSKEPSDFIPKRSTKRRLNLILRALLSNYW